MPKHLTRRFFDRCKIIIGKHAVGHHAVYYTKKVESLKPLKTLRIIYTCEKFDPELPLLPLYCYYLEQQWYVIPALKIVLHENLA